MFVGRYELEPYLKLLFVGTDKDLTKVLGIGDVGDDLYVCMYVCMYVGRYV